jgi:hypothetical protein
VRSGRFGDAARGFDDLIRRGAGRDALPREARQDVAGHIRCGAPDRIRIPARPAQYVQRRVPDRRPRTRRIAATSRGGTPDRTIGRAEADHAGARPYLFWNASWAVVRAWKMGKKADNKSFQVMVTFLPMG